MNKNVVYVGIDVDDVRYHGWHHAGVSTRARYRVMAAEDVGAFTLLPLLDVP